MICAIFLPVAAGLQDPVLLTGRRLGNRYKVDVIMQKAASYSPLREHGLHQVALSMSPHAVRSTSPKTRIVPPHIN